MRQLLIGLALVLVPFTARAADSNQTLNVEGILRDGTGALQSMAVGLDVSVYTASTGGTAFYTQHFNAVAVDSGYFTVDLAGAGLSFAGKPDVWVGIKVMGDADELPRVHVSSAPYAFSAASAATAASADALSATCVGCVTNAMLSGSIDGSKVGKVASATAADTAASATTATTATNADTATNANQLGGVAATSWQRALSPTACPAGQAYAGIAQNGTATCTNQISVAASANAVAFGNITGVPAACPAGQFLTGYSGGAAQCAALPFTTAGGTAGSATTVARGDHTHAGMGTSSWIKIYDQNYNANGVQTIPVTGSNGSWTIRIIFTGTTTNCCGNPSEIYLQTQAGGTSGYNSFLTGETLNSAQAFSTGALQPGFLLARSLSAANATVSFDYVLTESAGIGLMGYGQGMVRASSAGAPTLLRGGGVNPYGGTSTSISIAFWNTSNVTGRFTVLQLM